MRYPDPMGSPGAATAGIVVIGNEILSGRTRDENAPWLAARLAEGGVRLAEIRIVPDLVEAIAEAVNESRARWDHAFTTGGIGPTHDDITSEGVAAAFGAPLSLHPEAHALLVQRYGRHRLNDARLRMAQMPRGAELIENPVSGAPGFRLANVFVLAGVPKIMRAMFGSIRHLVIGGPPIRSRAVNADVAEGDLADDLARIQARFPDVEIGSYPVYGARRVGCSLVLRSTDTTRLDAAAHEVAALVRRHDDGADPESD